MFWLTFIADFGYCRVCACQTVWFASIYHQGLVLPRAAKEVTYKIMQGILMGMIASLTSTTFFIAEYTEIRKHVNLPYCHESQPKHVLDFLH
jgi:hypothetical protein